MVVNGRYQVALRLGGGDVPSHAYALLKRTLKLGPEGVSDAAPLALQNTRVAAWVGAERRHSRLGLWVGRTIPSV